MSSQETLFCIVIAITGRQSFNVLAFMRPRFGFHLTQHTASGSIGFHTRHRPKAPQPGGKNDDSIDEELPAYRRASGKLAPSVYRRTSLISGFSCRFHPALAHGIRQCLEQSEAILPADAGIGYA